MIPLVRTSWQWLYSYTDDSDYTATFISEWFTDEGGCGVTEMTELLLKMWASAYQRIMTNLPSHSGLYKRVYKYFATVQGMSFQV